jgi:hypothetical protein
VSHRWRPGMGLYASIIYAMSGSRHWIILFKAVEQYASIMPGDNEPAGFIMTTILGIVGAFVAVPRECLPALYGDIDMREARLPCGLELRC